MFNYESGCDGSVLYIDLTVDKKNRHRPHHHYVSEKEYMAIDTGTGVHLLTYSASPPMFKH